MRKTDINKKMAMMPSSDPELRLTLLQPSLKRSEPEKLSIDDMLQSSAANSGWQLRYFVLTSLAWALEAFHTMVVIFCRQ
uniref:Uncharacterized protein n=1 Tax=Manihot esculenta TaxID=3983 RepID=A0A2C9UDU3_MANES